MGGRPRVAFLLVVLTSVTLASLPQLDEDLVAAVPWLWARGIAGVALEWAFPIAVLAALVNVLADGWSAFALPRRERARIREVMIRDMGETLFQGEFGDIRYTIFRDAGIARSIGYFLILLSRFIWRLPQRCKPAVCPRINNRYLFVWQRVGTEYRRSRTFFYYSPETRSRCEGLAALARQTQLTKYVTINHGLSNDVIRDADGSCEVPEELVEYLDATSTTIETLRRLNVIAKHYAAEPLSRRDGRPIGVLMLDSVQDVDPFRDNENAIKRYVGLLQEVIE